MPQVLKESSDIVAFRRLAREKSRGSSYYVALLGWRDTPDTFELLQKIKVGISYKDFERFQKNVCLSSEAMSDWVQIKRRTLARRQETGRLTSEESDRLLRATRVFGKALALFEGDLESARNWFSMPTPALGDRTPQDMSTTELGSREVENFIGRLEHGVFS